MVGIYFQCVKGVVMLNKLPILTRSNNCRMKFMLGNFHMNM